MVNTSEEESDDLILRADRQEIGRMSRRPRKRQYPEPAPTPEPHRHTREEATSKIARTIVESSVKVTEEEALAKAAEYASEAGYRMSKGAVSPRKPRISLGALLEAIQNRNKNSGNG